jgi:phosphohistidine phosphatase
LRAKETAEILAKDIQPKEGLKEIKGLAPLDPVENLLQKIIEENKDIMIVSHLPFLQKFSSLILTGSEKYNLINFSQAGCICLEEKERKFGILWIITPELIR